MNFPEQLPVSNPLDGQEYFLIRGDRLKDSSESRRRLASICNQDLVYASLFKQRLGGRPYTEEDAAGFMQWQSDGWRSGEAFVFFIVDAATEVVGCIDIKSSNLENAEVGYWASADSPGNASNALVALSDAAFALGFRSLFARVRPGNTRSIRVVERAGFERTVNPDPQDDLTYYTRGAPNAEPPSSSE